MHLYINYKTVDICVIYAEQEHGVVKVFTNKY